MVAERLASQEARRAEALAGEVRERERVARLLAESERQFSDLVRSSPLPILVAFPAGLTVAFLNQRAADLLGTSQDVAIGVRLPDLIELGDTGEPDGMLLARPSRRGFGGRPRPHLRKILPVAQRRTARRGRARPLSREPHRRRSRRACRGRQPGRCRNRLHPAAAPGCPVAGRGHGAGRRRNTTEQGQAGAGLKRSRPVRRRRIGALGHDVVRRVSQLFPAPRPTPRCRKASAGGHRRRAPGPHPTRTRPAGPDRAGAARRPVAPPTSPAS